MSIVSPIHAPILIVCGTIAAFVHQRWLARYNEDWFQVIALGTVGLFWASLLARTLFGKGVWEIGLVSEVESSMLALFYALAYPFWFWLGGWVTFLLFGRRPDQGGLIWLYRIEDRTENFDSDLED